MFTPDKQNTITTQGPCCLLDAPAGSVVRVSNVQAEGGMRGRLCALGITPGCEMEISPECTCQGTRKITVRNSSLVLNEPMARAIECECVCQGRNRHRHRNTR